jgi:ankyrin repeat protein
MSKNTDICWFLQSGNIEKAKELIENHEHYEEVISDSYLVASAINSQKIEVVKYVIDLGINLNLEADEDGWSPLLIAAANADLAIFKLLVESGADINFISKNGDNAMELATEREGREIIDYLNSRPEFDINRFDSERSNILQMVEHNRANIDFDEKAGQLIEAVMKLDYSKLRKLINSGFNINKLDKNGMTPLGIAVGNGDMEMIRFLLEVGADPNLAQPLQYAVAHHSTEVMSFLIDAGANIQEKNNLGITILMVAAMIPPFLDPFRTVEFLIHKGADAKARDNKGLSVFDYVKKSGNDNNHRLINLLKIAGCEGIE